MSIEEAITEESCARPLERPSRLRLLREQALDCKVMLVDDEALSLEVAAAFLEEAGYSRFVATSDSREAFDLLVRERPDIVLLDLMMPGVSGFDILEQMQTHSELCYTPVIVLTSVTDACVKLRALECGATDFLAKPVDPSELRLRMRNTLALKAHQNLLVNYDPVTGLANRQLFAKQVGQALRAAKRYRYRCALLHLNLDRFGTINDALGHAVGDALLREVARRIQQTARESDPLGYTSDTDSSAELSRLGGDGFTLLLSRIEKAEVASQVAQRLLAAIAAPYAAGQREVVVTARIGIAVYPEDGADQETLLQHASAAMGFAKGQGRNTYHFYSSEMNARAHARLMLENDLRKAVERNELVLHFQPQVDATTGAVSGAEALVRWQHPELGLIAPLRFIPVAEDAGLIGPVGEWVLRQACKAVMEWQRAGMVNMRVAINVSGDQFREPDFEATLVDALANSGCDPRQVVLELTEGTLMDNAEHTVSMLHAIKRIGVKLSVDDFGTGYSSLGYLNQFPLDELKIDRSFVKDLGTGSGNSVIVRAIIVLASSLGLSVVAEGVETQEQLEFLRRHHCAQYQGYLFSKPLPATEFLELLSRLRRRPNAGLETDTR